MSFSIDVASAVVGGLLNRSATSFQMNVTDFFFPNHPAATVRAVINGTNLVYDANGLLTGGTLNSVAYQVLDGANVTTIATVDLVGGRASSAISTYLAQTRAITLDFNAWNFVTAGDVTFNPEGTQMSFVGIDGTIVRINGQFNPVNFSGQVTSIQHVAFDGTTVLATITASVPLNVVSPAFGGDGLSEVLFSGNDSFVSINNIYTVFTDFIGFAGSDTMQGTGLNSGVEFFDASTGVTVDLANGYAISASTGYDTLTNIKNIYGSDLADTFYGNDFTNVMQGDGGNDQIFGQGGDDLIVGDQGSDTLDGGSGVDTFIAGNNDLDDVQVNLLSGISVDSSGTDTIYNFENVNTKDGNDFVVGNFGSNAIYTRGGNDQVWAFDGSDVISSGTGNDVVVGGIGNDVLRGEDGSDWLYGQDDNDLLDAGTQPANSFDVLIGGNGDDTLYAGTGGFTYIYGGDGATGGGNDSYIVGSANAALVVFNDFEAGGANDTVRLQNTSYTSFAQVQAAMQFSGVINGTVLVVDADTQIWFLGGLQPSNFTAADFLFA